MDPSLLDDYNSRTGSNLLFQPDINVAHPNMFVITHCDSQSVNLFKREDIVLPKKIVALIIVGTDIMSLLFIIISYNLISYMQQDFSEKYDS